MHQWISLLSQNNVGRVLENESLAKYTTWKIGGPADALVIPENKEQMMNLVQLLHTYQIPWMQLGRGSNMLVSDKGIRGVVVKLGEGFDYAEFHEGGVTVGAAHSFVKLSVVAAKKEWAGLEFGSGIPGTVGGAVYMNAGAHGSDVSRIFKFAEIVLETGELVRYSKEDMDFAYRHSVLHDRRGIVLEAAFELQHGERNVISETMAAYKDRRRRTQPLQMACAGSVFRNPPGDHAARLIEAAGLKGMTQGGAQVSTMHANFIVNTGQATAEDVITLMQQIQSTISSQNGINLVPEVFVVGER